MWARKNSPAGCDGRPLPWVEDAVTGEIIAFVCRTNQTFPHLLHLLEKAKIEVVRWITDSWCRAAVAGLF